MEVQRAKNSQNTVEIKSQGLALPIMNNFHKAVIMQTVGMDRDTDCLQERKSSETSNHLGLPAGITVQQETSNFSITDSYAYLNVKFLKSIKLDPYLMLYILGEYV